MLRYAITERHMFPGAEQARLNALLAQIRHLAQGRAEVIQLREKDLAYPDLEALASRIAHVLQDSNRASDTPSRPPQAQTAPKFLVNGPARIAACARADGLHLPNGLGPADLIQARREFEAAGLASPLLSTSCHTLEDVRAATIAGFNYLLFGPIFEKRVRGSLVTVGLGLDQLRQAATVVRGLRSEFAPTLKLLALGGITESNAELCLGAGADGIAGIRLFL